MTNLTKAMKRMLIARERVANRNVFFSSVLYHMRLIESEESICPGGLPTMQTNGKIVRFHPKFVLENDKYVEGVLLHETLHAALKHIARMGDRTDVMLWQICCDMAINPVIKTIFPLPDDAVYPPVGLEGKTVEELYKLLYRDPPKGKKGGGGNTPPELTSGPFIQDLTPEEQEQVERNWDRTLQIAQDKGKRAGTLPGTIQKLIEELLPREVMNWKELTRDMVRDAKSKINASWSNPNRRMMGHGRIFPGRAKDHILKIAVCMDTSGSTSARDDWMVGMKTEAASLLEQQLVDEIVMVSTDTRVCNMETCRSPEDVVHFDLGRHGGGTDFDKAMKAVGEIEDLAGVVFLTDMATSSFGKKPDCPVVWVDWTNGQAQAPYGLTARYANG